MIGSTRDFTSDENLMVNTTGVSKNFKQTAIFKLLPMEEHFNPY